MNMTRWMDTQMGDLKKFVEDEHGKKRKHDAGGSDDGADQIGRAHV